MPPITELPTPPPTPPGSVHSDDTNDLEGSASDSDVEIILVAPPHSIRIPLAIDVVGLRSTPDAPSQSQQSGAGGRGEDAGNPSYDIEGEVYCQPPVTEPPISVYSIEEMTNSIGQVVENWLETDQGISLRRASSTYVVPGDTETDGHLPDRIGISEAARRSLFEAIEPDVRSTIQNFQSMTGYSVDPIVSSMWPVPNGVFVSSFIRPRALVDPAATNSANSQSATQTSPGSALDTSADGPSDVAPTGAYGTAASVLASTSASASTSAAPPRIIYDGTFQNGGR
ncbi:hypothetical protein IAT40_000999 [Kwoniella sp. CBS 6097]